MYRMITESNKNIIIVSIHSFCFISRQRQHVGFIDNSHQPVGITNRIIVSSDDNVIASLDLSGRKLGNYYLLPFIDCATKMNTMIEEKTFADRQTDRHVTDEKLLLT
jgi:hypothetical protein